MMESLEKGYPTTKQVDQNIIVFSVANEKFGIDVLKVQEIIRPTAITPIPKSHPNIEGVTEIRGEVLPVIHLGKALGYTEEISNHEDRFIITIFKDQKIIFHVDEVLYIHQFSSDEIEEPDELSGSMEGYVLGIVNTDDGIILMLDFEKIIVEIP